MSDNNKLDLSKYILSKLDTTNYKTTNEYTNNKKQASKCLKDIGKSLSEYTNFHDLLSTMNDKTIRELHEAIVDVQFFRKRFTQFVTCTRKEADKPDDETRSIGYFTYGEHGGEYGYFKHLRKLTPLETEWLNEYPECCYYGGQPCARWQDVNGNVGEDCECELGKEDSSLILYELDEQHEKEMGVWKQDIVWYLDTNYNKEKEAFFSSHDRYYSLTHVKKDALSYCENEKTCQKIFQYDGNQDFVEGNLRIYSVGDVDEFED
tara:strand:- start:978 stop:1766 length:789 start_codon:yes stop_codon:yes gene_type:complete